MTALADPELVHVDLVHVDTAAPARSTRVADPVAGLRLVRCPESEPRPQSAWPAEPVVAAGWQPGGHVASPAPAPLREDPSTFGHRIAQAVLDVVSGHRSAHQVLRWLHPTVFEAVRRRASVAACRPGGRRPVVRSVRACRPHPDAAEVAAVVIDGRRVRAVALRLEAVGNRWRVTEWVMG